MFLYSKCIKRILNTTQFSSLSNPPHSLPAGLHILIHIIQKPSILSTIHSFVHLPDRVSSAALSSVSSPAPPSTEHKGTSQGRQIIPLKKEPTTHILPSNARPSNYNSSSNFVQNFYNQMHPTPTVSSPSEYLITRKHLYN